MYSDRRSALYQYKIWLKTKVWGLYMFVADINCFVEGPDRAKQHPHRSQLCYSRCNRVLLVTQNLQSFSLDLYLFSSPLSFVCDAAGPWPTFRSSKVNHHTLNLNQSDLASAFAFYFSRTDVNHMGLRLPNSFHLIVFFQYSRQTFFGLLQYSCNSEALKIPIFIVCPTEQYWCFTRN